VRVDGVRIDGIFFAELTVALPLTSSFTAFAFFVVFRVLIRLFFSIVMAGSSSNFYVLALRFSVLQEHCQTVCDVPCRPPTRNKELSGTVPIGRKSVGLKVNPLVKNQPLIVKF
jgi:hypothetical protein